VNLMFLSGNEVYWHTRYEPSIDGSNTAYRTIVCYKETWDNAPTDPTGTSTTTWRDPRFGAAPGGGNPENALTGTAYMANTDDLPITVTKSQAQGRLWRNTGLASMSGSQTALAQHTVGYESDEDLDNGFRPAGLIDVSTTVGDTPQYLTDFGNTVVPGTTTHHLTLYRAASGALVFSAGTIQFGWGLDADHDGGDGTPADSRLQQATINMLADMHAQPSTPMSGLVAASPSTDATAPTSHITSPVAGVTVTNGTSMTVTGTASDVGGQVAGVEVSVDNGTTWHPATGTTSWSYTTVIHGNGPVSIRSRASDDSVNTETPSVGVSVTLKCPCSLFGSKTPGTPDSGDASAVELGVRFSATTTGAVTGIRFYKAAANSGVHTGTLWSSTGTQLATGTFSNETGSGWQTLNFSAPVNITANTTYVASYYAPNGHYSADLPYFYYRPYSATPLTAEANLPGSTATYNGVFASGHGFPNQTFQGANYYVDPLFIDGTVTLPTITGETPAPNSTAVPTSAGPTATFSKTMTASSIVFTLKDPSGVTVAGTVGYDTTTRTATFTPTAALRPGATYTASVTGADTDGYSVISPTTWIFSTAGTPVCPCTLFQSNATPTNVDSGDTEPVNLGLQFTPMIDGYITGVRFYKSTANTGTHTGAVWTSAGTQLTTGTFTNETATGWQTLTFANSIPVTGGTTYVVTYFAPKGHYSYDPQYFASSYTNSPLTAPANVNGVFAYDNPTFPTATFNATNYWVDAVFNTSAAPDTTPPTVTAATPASGSTNVPTSTAPTATFSENVASSSIAFTLKTTAGANVPGTVAYDSTAHKATFIPNAALADGTGYTATVTASDPTGNPMATPATWSFTTSGNTACPCTLFASSATPTNVDSGDNSAVNLGVKFVPSGDGTITGIRFYKASTNTGTHVGALWSSTGTQLATVTFTNETASGWQMATFSSPVAVTAGTTYLASYSSPAGHYSYDGAFFANTYVNGPLTAPAGDNGVFGYGDSSVFPTQSFNSSNYWVDPVYGNGQAPPDTTPPVVSGVTATGTSSTSATVSWTTDENATSRVDYGTSATSLNLNATVAGLSTTHSVPLAGLTPNTRYYYRVTSADAAGNSTTSPATSGAPASYAPTAAPITDATSADFGAGTASSTYVAGNGDGEVVLTPTVAQEFTGTTLPSGWTSSPVVTGGTSTVAGGSVSVSGANLSSTTTYTNGKSLELSGTLDKSQSIGWVGSSNANVKISFSVNASNQLIATVNDGFLNNVTGVAMTGWTAAPHKFRFEWTSSAATLYVDDVQKYTHAFSSVFSGNLKPLLSDSVRTDANLAVDWLRVGPYAASGTFTSRVFDGQSPVVWDGLSWDATVPAGATLTVKVRAGNTATPDASWTAFATIPTSGGSIGQTRRYVQYQLTLTSTGSRFTTAQVRSVTAAFHV
jgi:hypothetical protein